MWRRQTSNGQATKTREARRRQDACKCEMLMVVVAVFVKVSRLVTWLKSQGTCPFGRFTLKQGRQSLLRLSLRFSRRELGDRRPTGRLQLPGAAPLINSRYAEGIGGLQGDHQPQPSKRGGSNHPETHYQRPRPNPTETSCASVDSHGPETTSPHFRLDIPVLFLSLT